MKKVICGIAVSIILVACMMAGTLAADDSMDRAFGFRLELCMERRTSLAMHKGIIKNFPLKIILKCGTA